MLVRVDQLVLDEVELAQVEPVLDLLVDVVLGHGEVGVVHVAEDVAAQ